MTHARIRVALVLSAFCFVVAVLAMASVPVSAQSRTQSLTNQLSATVRNASLGARAKVGAYVIDLGSGSVILDHNGSTPLIPASNQKILTTAAALGELGPEFKFTTTLSMRGQIRGGVLDGDVLLRGTGDPNLSGRLHGGDVTRPLRELGYGLAKAGVRRVTGRLLYDASAFEGPDYHAEWPDDQFLRWYCAPVSALTLNDNCVTITVTPRTPGRKASIVADPASSHYTLVGGVDTRASRGDPKVGFSRARTANEIRVWGDISSARGAYVGEVTVADPNRYCATVMSEVLKANGIRVEGGVVDAATVGGVGTGWREAGRYETDVAVSVYVSNTRSQNLYAENLFRLLAKQMGAKGSFEGGSKAVKSWLRKAKLPAQGTVIADGSGLARSNRVSAQLLARTLEYSDKRREGGVMWASLAVSGETGTLERRLSSGATRGRVVAKTGTIRGVSALSGFVESVSGRRYAFSILINDFTGSARAVADRLVTELVTKG